MPTISVMLGLKTIKIQIYCCEAMVDGPSLPDGPDVPLSVKLGQMWLTNKPLFILLATLLTLLILGVIFVIVWFAIILPKRRADQNKVSESTVATVSVSAPTTSASTSTSTSTPSSTSTSSTSGTSSSTTSTAPASTTTTSGHFMQLRHHL